MRLVRIQQHARQQKVKQRSAQRSERTPWTFFACVLVSNPVPWRSLCSAAWNTRILRSSASMLYATVALRPCVPATSRSDPQQWGPIVLSCFRLHCCKKFAVHCTHLSQWAVALSSEHRRTASTLARFLLLAPIPRVACSFDRRWASRASPFFNASLSYSPRFRCPVFLVPFLCQV